jgi:exopolysaccharide biosynthesis polyprenyl glycosylphosphotransferase
VLTVSFFLISFSFIVVEKLFIKFFQNVIRSRGYNTRNVLVIGDGTKAKKLFDVIRDKKQWGINIVETVDINACELQDIKEILQRKVIDEVYISFSRDTQKKIDFENLLLCLEKFGKTVRYPINLDEVVSHFKINFSYIGHLPSLVFHSKTLDADQMLTKRVIDVCLSSIGLFITGIIFPFIAIAIRIESPGPILFAQPRVGMNGRRFIAFKFRSMIQDAESKKHELIDLNTCCGPIFKIEDDPRITSVGKILRRTSLDEFPQFWNVLKGEMSMVGSRPPTCDEVNEYQEWHYRRVSIPPGMTGLWQVNGRNSLRDFDEIVKMDLEYIDNWSYWLDFKIMLKTIWVVVRCTGR